MGKKLFDIDPLMPVVDDRYQPIVVALDVEHRARIGKVRSRQHCAHGMDVCEISLLEDLPPVRQRFGGIGVARGKTIQRFLLDDVHLGWNIATCYIYVNCGCMALRS